MPFVQKCDLCADRVARGQQPACVAACAEEACRFGDRDELIRIATRILEAHPGKYVPHIYGQHELGGTCVLYLSETPLDRLGWPEQVGDRPLKEFTWPVISKTPWVALGVMGFLGATMFVIKRRMELDGSNGTAPPNGDGGSADNKPGKE